MSSTITATATFLLWCLAIGAGVAGACQTGANSALSARANLGASLFLNTSVVLVGTAALLLIQGGPRALGALPGAPAHHYIGGLCGFTVIASITFAFPRLGAALAMALMVLGQGVMALIIDHHGLWGMRTVPLTSTRLVGVAFLVAGVLLLRR
jgi:bacterial/archaeal transporter family-2 protein